MDEVASREETLELDKEELRQTMELLFYAYRDFTEESDVVLARHGFGRAHHRVIYFVGRNPGISVGELLAILKITKQSLSRVLGQLVREAFIRQHTDKRDRRRRMLFLSEKGSDLEGILTVLQCRRLGNAYQNAGGGARKGFRAVLREILNEEDRHCVGSMPGDC
jgi:DNA-binding MarR family transcriptional regulator